MGHLGRRATGMDTSLVSLLLLVTTVGASRAGDDPATSAAVGSALPAPESEVARLARRQARRFLDAAGMDSVTDLWVAAHGSWVEVSAAEWVYRCDAAGNQTLRPRAWAPLVAGAQPPLPLGERRVRPSASCLKAMEDDARALQYRLTPNGRAMTPFVTIKRESLLTRLGGEGIRQRCFRTWVRFSTERAGGPNHFSVFLNDDRRVLRIDTNQGSPEVSRLRDGLIDASIAGSGEPGALADLGPIRVGAFYDEGEPRFVANAQSFLGDGILHMGMRQNPFAHDSLGGGQEAPDGSRPNQRRPGDRWWSHQWWQVHGRVGSALGTRSSAASGWSNANVEPFVQGLGAYTFIGGEPTARRDLKLADGSTVSVPFGSNLTMEPRFARDLEACTVAAISTHMGPLSDEMNLGRGVARGRRFDTWFSLGRSDPALGQGRLRHLMLCGCSNMVYYRELQGYSPLLNEFMTARYAGGIRTVSGYDGMAVGLDRDGWQFFGRYNQGDSVSDAWAVSRVGECLSNSPVTVGYGATPAEALDTTLDGRFAAAKAGHAAACASVWVNMAGDEVVHEQIYAFPGEAGPVVSHKQSWGFLRVNQSVGGKPLRIGSVTYAEGLGTHSTSTIVIALPAGARRVTGAVGVQPGEESQGTIVAAVRLDGRMVRRSHVLQAGMDAESFEINVAGGRRLELVVEDAGDGGNCDHANWVDLKVSR